MSTKKREVIFGGRIIGANIRAQQAREKAKDAICAADHVPNGERWIHEIKFDSYCVQVHIQGMRSKEAR